MSATTEQGLLDEPARFVGKASELRVVLIPPSREHHEDGTSTPRAGLTAEFKPDVSVGGLRGLFETRDPDVVRRLEAHPQYGDYFERIAAEELPPPDPSDELTTIAVSAAKGDVDAIADLYEREEGGHRREVVLDAARRSLLALEGGSAAPEGSQGDPED